MKEFDIPEAYIAYDRIPNKGWKRLDRILSKLSFGKFFIGTSKDIESIISTSSWYAKGQRTGQKKRDNPRFIFSGFDWNNPINSPLKKREYVQFEPGVFSFADFRDKAQLLKEKGVHCNPGFEIHTAFGCLHSCKYCHIGDTLTIMLDLEKFIENLSALMDNNPQQRIYKYDNQSDIPTLEPEYGAINDLVKFFGKRNSSQHLMLYTKSNNLHYLPERKIHNGKTIVCWTISCDDVARDYEIGAPSLEERLLSARHCEEKGYRTRFRFSPIIPIKGWKKKNSEMIEKVFELTSPEVISIETLCHMNLEQYRAVFGRLALTPSDNITEYELFSHEARLEIYSHFINEIHRQEKKHNKRVKLALCLETEKMWNNLGKMIGQSQKNFYCCCGEKCA